VKSMLRKNPEHRPTVSLRKLSMIVSNQRHRHKINTLRKTENFTGWGAIEAPTSATISH
jgi:hypothetical protein